MYFCKTDPEWYWIGFMCFTVDSAFHFPLSLWFHSNLIALHAHVVVYFLFERRSLLLKILLEVYYVFLVVILLALLDFLVAILLVTGILLCLI